MGITINTNNALHPFTSGYTTVANLRFSTKPQLGQMNKLSWQDTKQKPATTT
jgi:hypothetical protein